MASASEVTVKVEADSAAAAAAEEKLLHALAQKKLKVEAAAAAENRRLAELAAKWKEPGPLKLPPLPGMKVCAVLAALELLIATHILFHRRLMS
jgi:hypothetical protein